MSCDVIHGGFRWEHPQGPGPKDESGKAGEGTPELKDETQQRTSSPA